MTFDPRRLCGTLNEAGVRYVVIGGFAGAVHGSPLPTTDVDVLPSPEAGNLESLARALDALGAKLRTADGPVEAPLDAGFLASMPFMVNLVTEHGDLDIAFEPAGPRRSFDEWDADAEDIEIDDGLVIRVAGLDSVIESKRASGRPKDEHALPYLESLRDERARRES